MNWKKNSHWLLYLLFLSSCARQSSPTGGPKDTIPPILATSIPLHETVNYDAKTIELIFSEPVSVTNPKEQIIITPSIGKDYKVEARNQKIILTMENPLKDSTTYSFNFREAVQDITEKNPAKNLKLAFSTGTYIDSMTVSGIVYNIQDENLLNDITVALEPYNDTFSILKHPATYFTKSDKTGAYKLDNIKPGLYTLYAIADQNKNLFVDSKNEAYGFKRDSILLDHDIEKMDVGLTKLDLRPLKITSARPYNTYFNIKATKNLKEYSIQASDTSDIYASFGADRANIQIYNSFSNRDSIQIRAILTDSINNQVDTTLYAKFTAREVTPEKFTTEVRSTRLLADKGEIKIEVAFTKPLRELNFDSIYFEIDSLNKLSFDKNNVTYDESLRLLTLRRTFDKKLYKPVEAAPDDAKQPEQPAKDGRKPKTAKRAITNKLTLGRGAFISIENDSSASLGQNLLPQKTEDLGVIFAETKLPPDQSIIQLIDKTKRVKAEAVHKNKAAFEDLPPDNYQLRIIMDRNGNGVWDPGNYLTNEEPERIYYWKDEKGLKEIKLKANYEIGPLLIKY
jgi:uncharacterized protein (DUF2141 family)